MFNNLRLSQSRFIFVLLVVLLLVGSGLRLYQLQSVPAGFHIDEASLGYNGYSLLLTGKDENNQSFPLYIDMFGDNRPSGYHYLTILPIIFFGLTEFATRLPGAIFGVLTVLVMYFLASNLFQSRVIGITAATLYTIAPWSITLARAGNEPTVALFFVIAGFTGLIIAVKKRQMWFYIIGTTFLLASFFFYHTPRLFVPMFFAVFLLSVVGIKIRTSTLKHHATLLVSFVIVSVVAVSLVFFVTGGTGRFSQVNIFGFPETQLVMQEQIREDGLKGDDIFITRVFHNKIVNYVLTFSKNYFEYYTGQFLFISGGKPIWYEVPGIGLLYLASLPFLLYGAVLLFVSKQPFAKFPLLWIFVAPIVASITVDDVPNINRAIVLFPMLEVVTAYGLVMLLKAQKKQIRPALIILTALLFFGNFLYYQHQYYRHATVHRTWYRNNGVKEMTAYLKANYDLYDKIVITKDAGGIYPLILFYMQYDPRMYQVEGSPKDAAYTGFGKFYFVPQACPSYDKDDRFPKEGIILYVNKGECKSRGIVKTVLKEDGTKAFHVVDVRLIQDQLL
jgi:4-amino-4-deoxy-L-arabinose transferase-like glycosyltransferase